MMPSRSSTDVAEAELSRWLWAGSPVGALLRHVLHVTPGAWIALEVPTAEVVSEATLPGDIDVLAATLEAPELAVAIEFKRIKVTPNSFHTGLPGKVNELRRGVQQANALARLGFHRTYLLVAIVTDAREQTGGDFVLAGPTAEMLRGINEFPALSELAPGVGLAFVEATQPVDKEIHLAGQLGVHLRREAIPAEQPAALTASIHALLRGRLGEPSG